MYINGKNIEDFNARLMADPKKSESNISLSYLKSIGGTALTLFNQEFGVKELSFTLEFWADSRNSAFIQKSNVLKELRGICDIVLTDGFIYKSILSEISGENQISSEIVQVNFKMVCMQCGQFQSVSFTGNTTLFNSGTMKSDCSISFLSTSDINNFYFLLNGDIYNINKITANTVFQVDGLKKKVLSGSNNAIGLTNFVDFPKLISGENTFLLSQQNVQVTLGYYPIYM